MTAELGLPPAMGCDGQLWARQVTDLADLAHPELGDLTVHDTLEAMAARVLANAPPLMAVAGVSRGGYVALEMIRQAPARVERLALFGTRASMQMRRRSVWEPNLLATAPHADRQRPGPGDGRASGCGDLPAPAARTAHPSGHRARDRRGARASAGGGGRPRSDLPARGRARSPDR